jgi:hypothetical protein
LHAGFGDCKVETIRGVRTPRTVSASNDQAGKGIVAEKLNFDSVAWGRDRGCGHEGCSQGVFSLAWIGEDAAGTIRRRDSNLNLFLQRQSLIVKDGFDEVQEVDSSAFRIGPMEFEEILNAGHYFAQALDLLLRHLKVAAVGGGYPLAQNQCPDGRAQNRQGLSHGMKAVGEVRAQLTL